MIATLIAFGALTLAGGAITTGTLVATFARRAAFEARLVSGGFAVACFVGATFAAVETGRLLAVIAPL